MNPDQKIDVWVWFSDVDKYALENQVYKICGLSKDNFSLLQSDTSDSKSFQTESQAQANNLIDKTQNNTTSSFDYKIYKSCLKETASRWYSELNANHIESLQIDNDEILFVSSLTPSAILKMTKEQIIQFSKHSNIKELSLYKPLSEICATEESNPTGSDTIQRKKESMNYYKAFDEFEATGDGVSAILLDANYVTNTLDNFSTIENTSNIHNVYNHNIYTVFDTNIPYLDTSSHANYVASTFHAFAPDVTLYTVKSINTNSLLDVEWIILNYDIDIVNVSMGYNYYGYTSTSSSDSRWFDAIVSEYDITYVGSAGNKYPENSSTYVPNPANSYNSIAVGAYTYSDSDEADKMFDYRYNPSETLGEHVNYKPDTVAAAGDTSGASPTVAALAAMIIEVNELVRGKPDIIKAIILSSCHRKVLPASNIETQEDMFDGLTLKQGAGACDMYRALCTSYLGLFGRRTIEDEPISFTLNSIDNNTPNNVNFSITWLRRNSFFNEGFPNNVDTDPYYNLKMSCKINNIVVSSSEATYSGKQVLYYSTLSNYQPRITISKDGEFDRAIEYAYAIGYNVQYKIETGSISGKNAVGQTLTANSYYEDGTQIPSSLLSYTWYNSLDGQNWSSIWYNISIVLLLTTVGIGLCLFF